jgi:hypothetical protein
MATLKEYEKMSDSDKKKEDWMNSKWRPMMGWMYMVVCMMDMVVFPILWSLLQTLTHTQITQWQPLTLQGAGLFHIAMGAVLGIAAFGRTQEKLGGANNGGLNVPQSGASAFGSAPTGGFGAPAPRAIGPANAGFASPAPSGFQSNSVGPSFNPPGTLPPLPPVTNQPTGNPTKTPAAVDNPDA